VKGQVTTSGTQIINPRYVHFVSDTKAYVTDLYSPYINIINPKTFTWTGAIATQQAESRGYCSTEEMVQVGRYVYTNCWSYSNKLLVIDTETDKMVKEITLSSWQPKSMKADKNGKLWVITDGGYSMEDDSFSDNIPHLYRIDAETGTVEMDQALDTDEANVQIELNGTKDVLYIINNDIYKMSITASHLPVRPFIEAPKDANGRRHKLYGIGVNPNNGDLYVADAVDYSQAGMVYRHNADGTLVDCINQIECLALEKCGICTAVTCLSGLCQICLGLKKKNLGVTVNNPVGLSAVITAAV
jgi:DNA-binding beta-propeller fold protein YncE